jgi:uncharacterized membrane protein (UPF0127 family)
VPLTISSKSGVHHFTVEVAATAAEQERGLMFRNSLGPDRGMIFPYEPAQEVAFWMKNTLIPLDMIFIGADGVVKNFHVNARPLDTTSIPSEFPVRFVLEIPGGRSQEIGLAIGDKMDQARVGQAASSAAN